MEKFIADPCHLMAKNRFDLTGKEQTQERNIIKITIEQMSKMEQCYVYKNIKRNVW